MAPNVEVVPLKYSWICNANLRGVVNMLKELSNISVNAAVSDGQTPLHCAASKDRCIAMCAGNRNDKTRLHELVDGQGLS